MTQPTTRTVVEPGFDPIEIIDMGDHLLLMQRDEYGEVNSVVIGPQCQALISRSSIIQESVQ